MLAIITIQRIAKKRFYNKTIAAIKIQRAYRKWKANRQLKFLLKFKDNPLFKQSAPVIKSRSEKHSMSKKHSSTGNP